MKRILLLNAGHTEIPIIEELKKAGCYVITSGNRADMPGHKLADKYVCADYSDKEEILEVAKGEHIDGIVSCAYDAAYVTSAYVAEKLNLPGHDSYKNACMLHQKDFFKNLCAELDIPNPKSVPFRSRKEAVLYVRETHYPIIVKAVDQASGIGVLRADNLEEAIDAIDNAFDKSKSKRIVIEPYIVGQQESFVAFVINKKVIVCTACNCYSPINPYLIQTETMPSKNFAMLKEQLISITEMLFEKLDLVDGLITLQYIVKDGKPYIIEMMRRCLGNRFLLPVSYVTGFNWYQAMTLAELGIDCSSLEVGKKKASFAGHHAIMATKNGKYQGLKIPDEIMRHVVEYYDLLKKGDTIYNYLSERIGYLYYTYETEAEIEQAAMSFNQKIELNME